MKSQHLKPTDKDQTVKNKITCFLAGSIEQGRAEEWQTEVWKAVKHLPVSVFNPRRDDWDSSWKQSINNEQFRNQVNWELNHLNESTVIFMYLSPKTVSPISLLELGLFSSSHIIVCCPEGFERKGNVDIVCARRRIPVYEKLETATYALISQLEAFTKL